MTGAVGSKPITSTPAVMLPQINPQLALRVVGFQEYAMALTLLDRLLASVTPEEIQVIEQIVASGDEFTVYSNLSRRLTRESSTLSEPATVYGDDFARRGLGWIMALARVELGAIVAGFTERPEPFDAVRPSRLELPAFREIMEDSMRTHFWSLQNDPVLPTLKNRVTPDPVAIAYARRVVLALEFLRAVRKLKDREFAPAQRNELDRWELQLAQQRDHMLFSVLGLQAPQYSSGETTKQLELNACPPLAKRALQELRSGTAQIVADNPATADQVKQAAGAALQANPGMRGAPSAPGGNAAPRGVPAAGAPPAPPGK